MNRLAPLFAALLLIAGCEDEDASQAPAGAQGPLVLRVWDKDARAQPGAPPTTLVAGRAEQRGLAEAVRLSPVLIRRPIEGGVVYVHAGEAAVGGGQGVDLPGPVHLSGTWRGLPFTGVAEHAALPAGGRLELSGLRLARGGLLATVPQAVATRERIVVQGPLEVSPGAPAITTALAALPPAPVTPLLTPGDR